MKTPLLPILISLIFIFATSCKESQVNENTPSTNTTPAEDTAPQTLEIDAKTLKKLISRAASIDKKSISEIAATNGADSILLTEAKGETLTAHAMILLISRSDTNITPFIKIEQNVDPSLFAEALSPKKHAFSLCSLLHPEYLNDLNWKIKDSKIKGSFTFQATNKAYSGQADFIAESHSGNSSDLFVSSFILKGEGIRLVKKKRSSKWKREPLTE